MLCVGLGWVLGCAALVGAAVPSFLSVMLPSPLGWCCLPVYAILGGAASPRSFGRRCSLPVLLFCGAVSSSICVVVLSPPLLWWVVRFSFLFFCLFFGSCFSTLFFMLLPLCSGIFPFFFVVEMFVPSGPLGPPVFSTFLHARR